jgi:hypothetical protein
MVTAQATLTPVSNQTPVVVSIGKELSGSQWVSRFPGSSDISELNDNFRASVRSFISALQDAGATVRISATYRPPERAYLMHYSSKISRGEISPTNVPAMDGVNIEWDHGDNEKSKKAATQMANGYNIVYPPALISRHTERAAIDMTISEITNKTMRNANGDDVKVTDSSTLNQIGATYGCIKLITDPPHWSDNGH